MHACMNFCICNIKLDHVILYCFIYICFIPNHIVFNDYTLHGKYMKIQYVSNHQPLRLFTLCTNGRNDRANFCWPANAWRLKVNSDICTSMHSTAFQTPNCLHSRPQLRLQKSRSSAFHISSHDVSCEFLEFHQIHERDHRFFWWLQELVSFLGPPKNRGFFAFVICRCSLFN